MKPPDSDTLSIRRVWRYQRGNHNPYIEEGQTTQWPKEKRTKDKEQSTKHPHKTKDRVPRTSLKIGVNWYGREGYNCKVGRNRRTLKNPLNNSSLSSERIQLMWTSGMNVIGDSSNNVISTHCELYSFTWWGVLDTTVCDKDWQRLVASLWFSSGITDCHDIIKILL
jgi:hypothetical protein